MTAFFAALILYIYTLFPGLAPYRDTGEMVSAAHTLGIAHPPGYPFYTLISKIFLIIIPWGNAGYKLNILSALAGAGTSLIIYKLFADIIKNRFTAVIIAVFFASSYLQWYLSLVSEMYTINTLFAAAVIYLLFKLSEGFNNYLLIAFIFGLGLGNRMDLLLLCPGMLWILFKKRQELNLTKTMLILAVFAGGYSIFLYLLIRSGKLPYLDWNHPATLERLWASIVRKTHGGTLDLISASYMPGENFIAGIKFYAIHLWNGFYKIGVLTGIIGAYSLWKRKRDLAIAVLLSWFCTGPLFIYMGNMPPNTHALAILEAHFLLPNLIFFIFIGEGFNFLFTFAAQKNKTLLFQVSAVFLVLANINYHYKSLNKRDEYIAYDYSKNILRSLPYNSAAVMKKDVQLFAMWNRQLVEGSRPDAAIISQGLSGSFWYQQGFKQLHPKINLCSLRNSNEWGEFMKLNSGREVFFSNDAEYFRPEGYNEIPCGLMSCITNRNIIPKSETLLEYIYPYRGKYLHTAYKEFFTPDIIDDYAKARMQLGQYYVQKSDYQQARKNFNALLAMQPLFPMAYNFIAFSYFQEGNLALAKKNYIEAAKQYSEMLKMAEAFNSLEDVKTGLKKDLSVVYVSLGVCCEKMGTDNDSLDAYQKALDSYPSSKAYYNRAVIMWKRKNWDKVISELENALRLEPGYKEAQYFLIQARNKLKQ